MGTGYKHNSVKHEFTSIGANINADFLRSYRMTDGYFGIPGKNKKEGSDIRNIVCDNPQKEAFDFVSRLSHNYHGMRELKGRENKIKGRIYFMDDKSIITYRVYSSSDGSPVVEINFRRNKGETKLKDQKIHFVGGSR